ncbi:hypothetical protein Rxycam_01580 [Rubrobacter xylanophilus DSM 9941]|uniref:hypothetical protein n=1 Tax=Rubrobacter xylanophilus TaxID=49319 RepID=UPI001C6423BA|nr:hypothetical protein [Rubrobacter xylanophilus]QYJ15752.1 hypothetical protein Rxycam_01580 [Rubrobacter xylanophilus DSM 9941]
MRKVMMLAAMLAMVLVAAAPALAQANAVGGDVQVQYQECTQLIQALGAQGQYGDATAVSGDIGSASAASIAQELGISVDAVQNCLQAGGDINVSGGGVVEVVLPSGEVVTVPVGAAAAGAGAAAAAGGGAAAAAAGGVLPETGGASLIALGAGALLVAGGLLARRVLR